jgi:hypothetical protein
MNIKLTLSIRLGAAVDELIRILGEALHRVNNIVNSGLRDFVLSDVRHFCLIISGRDVSNRSK